MFAMLSGGGVPSPVKSPRKILRNSFGRYAYGYEELIPVRSFRARPRRAPARLQQARRPRDTKGFRHARIFGGEERTSLPKRRTNKSSLARFVRGRGKPLGDRFLPQKSSRR